MKAGSRPRNRLWVGVGAAFLVLAAVLVLIIGSSSGDDPGPEAKSGGTGQEIKRQPAAGKRIELEGVAAVNGFFAGYPQNAAVIGDPSAPVEMVEYSDLRCTACKRHMEDVLPQVIERQIKRGAARIDFRFMVVAGQRSNLAGAAAYAASLQGRGWNYIGIFFRNREKENSNDAEYDDFLEAVAEAAGVKDLDKWNADRAKSTTWVQENTEEAENVGLRSAPGVTVRPKP
jgi:protein-disulfide isomerase